MRTVLAIGFRSFSRFAELDGFDRAMALAGQAFAALLPLLIVIGSVAPTHDDSLADTLIDRFDLSGSAAEPLRATVARPPHVGLFSGIVAFALSLGLSTTLWLLTPWLLTARAIAWQRLLPQAVLTAIGLLALAIGAAFYLPRAVSTASAEFGILGVAFTMLSLLFALCLVLVGTAALGATLAESREAGDVSPDQGH
jgi:uncharacterized BrkB/YihY/UPF0761 family membrane protein